MSEHVRVLTDSAIVINRIVQLLDEEKIPSIIKDNVESARLAGFGIPSNDVDLYVDTSDVNSAEMIIKSFIKKDGQQ
ncbi:putative signal transducing protein [Planktosalinus lacus]|uniref:DUF2007 domain-containing protein n=1 Tax=Planktosalinus lacus TaxID=1526573 RepID=A0A8J2Y9P6_9FLAO|nr:DUF2007 domain-containing protein [Planktosalinus lacus]GGD99725.1 hypothetical protein GCM10011312_24030 [Planktosalinus lacus]